MFKMQSMSVQKSNNSFKGTKIPRLFPSPRDKPYHLCLEHICWVCKLSFSNSILTLGCCAVSQVHQVSRYQSIQYSSITATNDNSNYSYRLSYFHHQSATEMESIYLVSLHLVSRTWCFRYWNPKFCFVST